MIFQVFRRSSNWSRVYVSKAKRISPSHARNKEFSLLNWLARGWPEVDIITRKEANVITYLDRLKILGILREHRRKSSRILLDSLPFFLPLSSNSPHSTRGMKPPRLMNYFSLSLSLSPFFSDKCTTVIELKNRDEVEVPVAPPRSIHYI